MCLRVLGDRTCSRTRTSWCRQARRTRVFFSCWRFFYRLFYILLRTANRAHVHTCGSVAHVRGLPRTRNRCDSRRTAIIDVSVRTGQATAAFVSSVMRPSVSVKRAVFRRRNHHDYAENVVIVRALGIGTPETLFAVWRSLAVYTGAAEAGTRIRGTGG